MRGWLLIPLLTLCLAAPALADTDARQALHALNRLAFGPTPGDLAMVEGMGVGPYIQSQLNPESIPEPDALKTSLGALLTLAESPSQLVVAYGPPPRVKGAIVDRQAEMAARKRSRAILEDAISDRLMRAIDSPRQLQEVMVDFWFNHFNVDANKGQDRFFIGDYEDRVIRGFALGRFRDLVGAVAKSPAMLFYLDNWQNTAPGSPGARGRFKGINENFARELMELHTLGVEGGYSQNDVISLAKILTGWGFKRPGGRRADSYDFAFNPRRHDAEAHVLLGRTIPAGGEEQGEAALDLLCRAPATAHHISAQLAQYFVSDVPPPALVDRLSRRFLATDGDIRQVLATLFASPEFWASENTGNKFKTPLRYVISAVRATGRPVDEFGPLTRVLASFGEPLYGFLTPDGYKNTQDAWLSPSAMTQRLNFALSLAQGYLRLDAQAPGQASGSPVEPSALLETYGHQFSSQTLDACQSAAPRLRGGLLLGSPEMMYY